MIELPEAVTISKQINETLAGKTITDAVANGHPHAFAWYTDDPNTYGERLRGKKVISGASASGYTCGGNIEVICGDMLLVLSTPVKYHAPGKLPAKHQLLITFDDGSMMSCTVQMWGAMLCLPLGSDTLEQMRDGKPSPLSDEFDESYFNSLRNGLKPTMSAKAFLATEQRIPGLGNGVLHDILFNTKIHPKRKLETLNEDDFKDLFNSVKNTLKAMAEQGGRDTEKDFFGKNGGYETILSNKTLKFPCRVCGGWLTRESYLGGNIYFCAGCQKL